MANLQYKRGNIRSNVLHFDAKMEDASDETIMKKFVTLSKLENNIVVVEPFVLRYNEEINDEDVVYKPLGDFACISLPDSDYERAGNISDHFSYEVRMKAHRRGKPSPWDMLTKNHLRLRLISRTANHLRKDPKKVTVAELKEQLYFDRYEVTTFRPEIVIAIAKAYGVKSMLDISAGWGDRLIGALAAGISYEGTDPNSTMAPIYGKIVDYFATNGPKYGHEIARADYIVHNDPFETVKILGDQFDMVLTSPPYFDYEIYDDRPAQGQSIEGRDIHQWYRDFLLFSMEKAWTKLRSGGWMFINIEDTQDVKVTHKLVVDFHPDCYQGVLGYSEIADKFAKKVRAIYVWRK